METIYLTGFDVFGHMEVQVSVARNLNQIEVIVLA